MTGQTTLEARAPMVCGNKKADEGDAGGNFEAAQKTSTGFSPLEDTASFAGGEGMEAETKRKMFMSPEDIDVILSHKARGDSFQAVPGEDEEGGGGDGPLRDLRGVREERAGAPSYVQGRMVQPEVPVSTWCGRKTTTRRLRNPTETSGVIYLYQAMFCPSMIGCGLGPDVYFLRCVSILSTTL